MAYSNNILPKSAVYYNLSRAKLVNSELIIEAGGYAEIQISKQMLPILTSKMLVVAHPSIFSDYYTNNALQITISIVTSKDECIEYLIPVSEDASGVFNTEISLPEGEYQSFKYKISSVVPLSVYNWELCAEEDAATSIVIGGVEQALPRLLYDYNTYAYAVGQKELTVGLITCYLLGDTDLQGHFTISFFATQTCNVHVRIKDNGITELFSPQVYTVERGYASISIAHAYLKKLAVDHAFSVTIQCTNGQLSIPVRGMLYTIDGGYLADRLLDAGIDVQDLTIKQTPTDSEPSEIWAIGFEGKRLIIKNREYSQRTKANWSAVKDLGEVPTGAIEFYARWTLRRSVDKYTMETEELPHAFTVDIDGNLRTHFGESFDEVLLLDTGVTNVSACQGFSSMLFIEQDQGLIVAYVKAGNVYYRQYAYNADIDGPMWYPVETLYEEGDAMHVSVHRLPDYRTGICVQHKNGTKWYITERMYVSQAAKPEVANITTDTAMITSIIDANSVDTNFGLASLKQSYIDILSETGSTNIGVTKELLEQGFYFNVFEMHYNGKLLFIKNKSISDLSYNWHVYLEGVEITTDVREITMHENILKVTLNRYVLVGHALRIVFNCFELVTVMPNNCYHYTVQDYTWIVPPPVTNLTSDDEQVTITASSNLDLVVRELTTTRKKPVEDVDIRVSASLDCLAKPIINNNILQQEDMNIKVTSSLSLVVLQVNTSPV